MKTKLPLLILLFTAYAGMAQVDTTFWNPQMMQLAESNSINGWIKVQRDKHYNSKDFFINNKQAFGLAGDDVMEKISTYTDDLGLIHYKFQQTYKSLKVEGCEYILHEENGKIISASGKLSCNLIQNVIPSIDETTALNVVFQDLGATKYGWEKEKNEDGELLSQYPIGELMLARIKNNEDFSNSNYKLTYRFEVTTVEPFFSKQAIYVEAKTGNIVKKQNLILYGHCNCCQGTTNTLYHGGRNITTKHNGFPFYQYVLLDNCRGDGIQAYYQGGKIRDPNNTFVNSHGDKVGASAHWAAEMTYDYFLNNHNRYSFDNNGAKINLYTGVGVDDAYWDGSDLYFGDSGTLTSNDLVSLDVVGHEFTHAVTQYSANLTYANESGALNESFSDIFGTMVEYYGLNGAGDYLLGEDYWIADGKARDMQNPNSKNQPDTYGGTYWSYLTGNSGEIHINSGVQNFWFYLLSEGGVGMNDIGNSYNVQGIGRNQAAAIAYRNLTAYLTSSSNYSDAKNGAIWSAMDLYGTCSNEVLQTIKAWDAVGVSSIGGVAYNVSVNCNLLNYIHNQGFLYTSRAINNLESDCDISSNINAQVTFIAGNSIILKPGFRSSPNFIAFIAPCLSNIQLRMDNNSANDIRRPIIEMPKYANDIFKIYPNPTTGQFTIELENISTDVLVEVYDAMGKMIFAEKTSENNLQIDISNQPKGIYLVKIINGNNMFTQKVVYQ
ncbi:MAG: hypothetical protein COA97_10110 [Flavobacteriales bacterium]|nr:MAG: hypothetical protein COA97_10110 [Flavobacteriales bacterium]